MQMLHEMATTGIAMAALVTAVWAGTVLVEKAIVKKAAAESVEVGGDK
jgi:pyruvate/oxaloacetate carboxyltransferase